MQNTFQLSDEQHMLRDSVHRFIADRFNFEQWRAALPQRPRFNQPLWHDMAEMGWLGVGISTEAGGTGAHIGDLLVVMEGLGRGLVLSPYVGSTVLAGQLLDRVPGTAAQELLQGMVRGETLTSVAHAEPGGSWDAAELTTTARRDGASFVLQGRKRHVLNADVAQQLIVSARVDGDDKGVALLLVPRNAPGLQRTDFLGPDKHSASDLALDGVRVPASALLASGQEAADLLARALDVTIVACLAEALGCMDTLRELTHDYIKTRQQFGVAIGSFQVLRHRMADVVVACEESRALLLYVASLMDGSAAQRANAASAAKVRIGQLGTFVAKQAVQMHGAIGVTDELAVSHHFKRLMMIFASFGGADDHLQRFSATRPMAAASRDTQTPLEHA
ncbi:acyl-CoA dehydrogenase family protein [Hydrogenophaga sp.]|uniref:acyl-CoA dehydrogenase family protein n=1 Tax=Hydrogenophaga sp. TaxID=1904254 RepID=UPI002721C28F|nr:acyl-CoA dehydrogenase [Hydrogenophaga sp.]MDO9435982.1 acyl-CoA dehydrogenase [Hydrogenophaga sp.]